jgi:hypothetical protein
MGISWVCGPKGTFLAVDAQRGKTSEPNFLKKAFDILTGYL